MRPSVEIRTSSTLVHHSTSLPKSLNIRLRGPISLHSSPYSTNIPENCMKMGTFWPGGTHPLRLLDPPRYSHNSQSLASKYQIYDIRKIPSKRDNVPTTAAKGAINARLHIHSVMTNDNLLTQHIPDHPYPVPRITLTPITTMWSRPQYTGSIPDRNSRTGNYGDPCRIQSMEFPVGLGLLDEHIP